jgi:hypothetical protein
MRLFAWERPCPDPLANSRFVVQTGVVEAVWYEHLEDVTLAHIDGRTHNPDELKGEVSAEGSEDNPPVDQNRKGAFGLPRVELQYEKHT